MGKMVLLLDSDKSYASARMLEEARKHKELIEKTCEIWVGSTISLHNEIDYWIKEARKSFDEVFLFPGRPIQALGGKHATYILVPELLNKNPCFKNALARLMVKTGETLAKILYPKNLLYKNYVKCQETPVLLYLGYLILGPESKVGRATGSLEIGLEDALERIKSYLKERRESYAIYIEAGSGAKRSVTGKLKLIEKAREIIKEKKFYAGGGLRGIEEINRLLDLDVNPVISSYFEENPKEIYRFAREVYKRV